MNLYPVLAALAVGALLSGCGGDRADQGPLVSERREVESFDSIEVKGAAKLEITIGEPLSVLVNGHEHAVSRVETDVRGDTLHIKSRPRDWVIRNNNSRLTVQITVPRLKTLELEGGNDANVVGLNGGDTKIKAAGAANIRADGQLEELVVEMSGAGHADLSKLAANAATVTVDGVGSVIVNPRDSLDATMNGVGAILYIGTPSRVNTRMNGLGTIGQRNPSDGSEAESNEPADPESLQLEREDPQREEVDYKSKGKDIVI
jgi:hypothetical protein